MIGRTADIHSFVEGSLHTWHSAKHFSRDYPRVPRLESCLGPQRHLPAGWEGSGGTGPRSLGRNGYPAETGARWFTGLVLPLE